MDLGEFRALTKDMPDDVELIMESKANFLGNCWEVLAIEATSVSNWGIKSPALKFLESDPDWADEDSELVLFVNPTNGQWYDTYNVKDC